LQQQLNNLQSAAEVCLLGNFRVTHRLCLCGCGTSLEGRDPRTKTATSACRQRVKRATTGRPSRAIPHEVKLRKTLARMSRMIFLGNGMLHEIGRQPTKKKIRIDLCRGQVGGPGIHPLIGSLAVTPRRVTHYVDVNDRPEVMTVQTKSNADRDVLADIEHGERSARPRLRTTTVMVDRPDTPANVKGPAWKGHKARSK
jgi:hypothetical protein